MPVSRFTWKSKALANDGFAAWGRVIVEYAGVMIAFAGDDVVAEDRVMGAGAEAFDAIFQARPFDGAIGEEAADVGVKFVIFFFRVLVEAFEVGDE